MPVARIAKSLLGFLIEEHHDIRTLPNAPTDEGHLSGMLDPNEGIIYVDRAEAARSPQRTRFTIGHEIGHSRMHVVDASGVFADPSAHITELPAKATAVTSEHRRRETEADMFASELLMPELLLLEHARATCFNLPALAQRFDVSVPAIRMRLRLLGLLPRYMA